MDSSDISKASPILETSAKPRRALLPTPSFPPNLYANASLAMPTTDTNANKLTNKFSVDELEDKGSKNSVFVENTQTKGLCWCSFNECGSANKMPQEWCTNCGYSNYAMNGNASLNNNRKRKLSGGSD